MIHSLGRLRALVVILGALPVGCKPDSGPPPVTNPGSVVLVKVWAVLGDNEQLGNDYNWGCRMSQQDIEGFIGQLQGAAGVFGGVQFWWPDGEPEELHPAVVDRPMTSQEFDTYVLDNWWWGSALNIYFVGHVLRPPPVSHNEGWTIPPDHPDEMGRRYIVIQDGGWPTGQSGFETTPDELSQSHLLEHEVAHFLLRRRYCTPYDSTEHVPDNYGRHLLRPYSPSPLELPQSEMSQIMCRVWGNTWRDLSDTCGSECPP